MLKTEESKFNKKLLYVSLSIIITDLLTKISANALLPFQKHVFILSDRLSFYLTYNFHSTNSLSQTLLKNEINLNLALFSISIGGIFLAICILLMHKHKSKSRKKWLLIVPILFFYPLLSEWLISKFPVIQFPNHFISWFSKIGALSLLGVFIFIIREKWIRLFLIGIFSAGIGNLLSHFYPPFHVIDFIYVKGSFETLRLGIFNFADMVFDLFFIALISYLFIFGFKSLIIKLKKTVKKRTDAK